MKVDIKNQKELLQMQEGGRLLGEVRRALAKAVAPGVSAMDIEELACKLIKEKGGKPSFKMVPGYSWATCINVNTGVVHGIPKKETIFKEGDVVSVDVGIFYEGFHTDTATTVYLGTDSMIKRQLDGARAALKAGISKAKCGNLIGDISKAIGDTLSDHGLTPIWNLTGHGVGRNLHEDPKIPNFFGGSKDERVQIESGMTLAIEVMCTRGSGDIVIEKDGWTLRTKDATIAALFEETVIVNKSSTLVITK